MENESIISRLTLFIADADEEADAWSVTGHDDNSYDAGRLRDEATAIKEALEGQDALALQKTLDDSSIDATTPEEWLDEAETQLGDLC